MDTPAPCACGHLLGWLWPAGSSARPLESGTCSGAALSPEGVLQGSPLGAPQVVLPGCEQMFSPDHPRRGLWGALLCPSLSEPPPKPGDGADLAGWPAELSGLAGCKRPTCSASPGTGTLGEQASTWAESEWNPLNGRLAFPGLGPSLQSRSPLPGRGSGHPAPCPGRGHRCLSVTSKTPSNLAKDLGPSGPSENRNFRKES